MHSSLLANHGEDSAVAETLRCLASLRDLTVFAFLAPSCCAPIAPHSCASGRISLLLVPSAGDQRPRHSSERTSQEKAVPESLREYPVAQFHTSFLPTSCEITTLFEVLFGIGIPTIIAMFVCIRVRFIIGSGGQLCEALPEAPEQDVRATYRPEGAAKCIPSVRTADPHVGRKHFRQGEIPRALQQEGLAHY